MAQKDLVLRLIENNKIVGYMQLKDGEIYYQFNITDSFIDPSKNQVPLSSISPQYDSIEPGIKVGETWWFEGDMGHIDNPRGGDSIEVVIEFDGTMFKFARKLSPAEGGDWSLYFPEYKDLFHKTGTIHEEVNDGKD